MRYLRKLADHYSARTNQTLKEREASPIIHLRKLNNWINNVLIQLYAKRGDAVLDLPCGKGGDLIKWDKAKIVYYVGIDIADSWIRKVKEDDESNVEGQSYESHSVYELSTVSHSPLQVDDPKEEEKELSSELIRSPQAQDTSSYKRTLSGWSSQPNSRGANDCNIAKDQLKKFCKFLSAASST
nr:mRNA cap guanine-N7 methyltransferase-like isoform X2 [Nicotiana tomentosiformis]